MSQTLMALYWRVFPRLVVSVLRSHLPSQSTIKILDIGCGNHSPSIFKLFFPKAHYTGLDRETDYELSPADKEKMDAFILFDLNVGDWSLIPDENYDVITMVHVIEHIQRGEEVLENLWRKLKPGGYLYVETPTERSLYLPSMPGTLNFFDDPTHVRLYPPAELANLFLRLGGRVLRVRIARNWRRMLAAPLLIPLHLLFKGTIRRGALYWDWTGFAYYILVQKPSHNNAPNRADTQR